MANDVAKIIWELAKLDKSFEGLSLKKIYLKKLDMDKDDLRKKLASIVADYIQKNPIFMGYISLATAHGITGSTATFKKQAVALAPRQIINDGEIDLNKSIFGYKHDANTFIEVTNQETKFLIEFAILPLDLKWKLANTYDNSSQITISWDHWNLNK